MDSILEFIYKVYNHLWGAKIPDQKYIEQVFSHQDQDAIIKRIHGRKKIRVGFLCMTMPVWKYETIFRELMKMDRYEPVVLFSPKLDGWKLRKSYLRSMLDYCTRNEFPYIKMRNSFFNIGADVKKLDLDIVFFAQPYYGLTCKQYSFDKFHNSLLFFIQYDNALSTSEFSYNSLLHRIAYRLYYPFEEQKRIAADYGIDSNKIVAAGPICYDIYKETKPFKWNSNKKKIIWAPHHTIMPGGWVQMSCFLDICDYMFVLAEKYKEQIVIAFKPHPHLLPNLIKLWGVEKANKYYERWGMIDNGLLCEGDSYALFKESDALIHDCASFTFEYMMTGKPCQYLLLNKNYEFDFIESAKKAFDAHYKAFNKNDIELFIVETIINGRDEKKDIRDSVIKDLLLSKPNNTTDTVISDIVNL